MKKKKLIVRRKSRFQFRPIHLIAAFAVLLGLSLYSAFAKGSGPLSFLASRANINIITDQCGKYEPEYCIEVDGCKLSGGKCVSTKSTAVNSGAGGSANSGGSSGSSSSSSEKPPKTNEACGRLLPEECEEIPGCKKSGSRCVSTGKSPTLSTTTTSQGGSSTSTWTNTTNETSGFCQTNGAPVKVGTWAATGGSGAGTDPSKADCAQCKEIKPGRIEFDGNNIQDCAGQIAKGQPVTLPGYANHATQQFCGTNSGSCQSCLKCTGSHCIQYGIGQSMGNGIYCGPNGKEVTKTELETAMQSSGLCDPGWKYVSGVGCQKNENKEEIKKEPEDICKNKCTGKNQRCEKISNGAGYKCVGTANPGATVGSKDECASGVAYSVEKGPKGKEYFEWVCGGAKGGQVVSSAQQCASGYAENPPWASGSNTVFMCVDCKAGVNTHDASGRSFYTCDGGRAVYHTCPEGYVYDPKGATNNKCKEKPTSSDQTNNSAQTAGSTQNPTSENSSNTLDPKFIKCMDSRPNPKENYGCRLKPTGSWEHYKLTSSDTASVEVDSDTPINNTNLIISNPNTSNFNIEESNQPDYTANNLESLDLGQYTTNWLNSFFIDSFKKLKIILNID